MPEPYNPISLNRYAYVYNSPVNYTDSSGHIIDTLWDAIGLGMDLRSCLGETDSLACYMLPVDVAAVALPFATTGGLGDDALRAARGVEDVGGGGLDTIAAYGRHSGQPFAFGQGSRAERAIEIVSEAGRVSGMDLVKYIDDVGYNPSGSSFFFVDAKGRRVIVIGSNAFRRTRVGQIMEATHELVHAEQFDILVRKYSGNIKAAKDQFRSLTFGSPEFAFREVVTERAALQRVERYFGGLSPQQKGASIRYINDWREAYLYGRLP